MRRFVPLYILVAVAFASQQTLNPVLAPLAREVGLTEWQIGLVISSAAVMVVATSVVWGRAATSRGPRPVLTLAFGVAAAAMAAFAVTAVLAQGGSLPTELTVGIFLITRGLLFGAALAAVGPTVQAVIAAVTPAGPERVAAIAGVGAAQGSSIVLGAALGAVLGVFGLIVPLVAVPIALLVGVVLTIALLPRRARAIDEQPAGRVSPRDPRVRDFLLAAFLLYSALGFIQLLIGFVVVDRYALSTETATAVTGAALAAAGIGVIVAQGVLVPRLGWSPRTLLLVGASGASVGIGALGMPAAEPVTIALVGLVGVFLGLATPGATAGATMAGEPGEQGAIAGLMGATIAASFVVAPLASTALYAIAPTLSFASAAACAALVVLIASVSPSIRSAGAGFGRPNSAPPSQLE